MVFDVGGKLGRQQMAVADQQQMRLRQAAQSGAGSGDVGGAAGGLHIRRIGGNVPHGAENGPQMPVQDVRQQTVEIADVTADHAG